jgi:hypothetical protein
MPTVHVEAATPLPRGVVFGVGRPGLADGVGVGLDGLGVALVGVWDGEADSFRPTPTGSSDDTGFFVRPSALASLVPTLGGAPASPADRSACPTAAYPTTTSSTTARTAPRTPYRRRAEGFFTGGRA